MSDQDRKIWAGVLSHLRSEHPAVCRHWFEDLQPLGVQSGVFGVRAASPLHREYLIRNALEGLNDGMRTVTGQLISVRILGPDEAWHTAKPEVVTQTTQQIGTDSEPGRPTPSSMGNDPLAERNSRFPPTDHDNARYLRSHAASERDRLGGPDALPINPDYAFENFVQGTNNQLALAAARAVAAAPGQAYNPLFVYGDVGLGKTHLLQAICLRVMEARPELRMLYVSCDGFVTRFMSAVQSGKMSEFRHLFRDVDLLVIDDIQFLANRDQTQEEFFHTFNALYQAKKQIVLSSDRAPDDIADLEARLVSRFNWGLVTDIKKPGFETRVEIIRRKAAMRGQQITTEVAQEIARLFDGNIRELEGAITRLQIVASIKGTDTIDLDLAREALADLLPPAESAPVTVDVIIDAVAGYYQIKRTDILGKRKLRSVALPRQVAMYLAREGTSMSYEEIGIHFGGRDHTTVMHAVSKINGLRGEAPEIDQALDIVADKIGVTV